MPRGAGVGGPIRRGGRGAKKLPSTSALQQLDANLVSMMPKEVRTFHCRPLAPFSPRAG